MATQEITNANVSVKWLAPRIVIQWGQDENGRDVGRIVFRGSKHIYANGELLAQEDAGEFSVRLEELFAAQNADGSTAPARSWTVAEIDEFGNPTGNSKVVNGYDVAQAFKVFFEEIAAEKVG